MLNPFQQYKLLVDEPWVEGRGVYTGFYMMGTLTIKGLNYKLKIKVNESKSKKYLVRMRNFSCANNDYSFYCSKDLEWLIKLG